MAGEIEEIGRAFIAQEEVDGFLTKLEQLKADGSVTAEQYVVVREEYEQRLTAANSEIERIKNDVNEKIKNNQHDIRTCCSNLLVIISMSGLQ